MKKFFQKFKTKIQQKLIEFRISQRAQAARRLSAEEWDMIYSSVIFCYGEEYCKHYPEDKELCEQLRRKIKAVYFS